MKTQLIQDAECAVDAALEALKQHAEKEKKETERLNDLWFDAMHKLKNIRQESA